MNETNFNEQQQIATRIQYSKVAGNYNKFRRENIATQYPHLIVNLNEIISIGENVYSVGNNDFTTNKGVSQKIDDLIGLSTKNKDLIQIASGNRGVTNVRNYFNAASSIKDSKRVVLIANPKEHTVIDVKELRDEYISANQFFDFMELFIDKYDYSIDKFFINDNIALGSTVYLTSNRPEYSIVADSEEFMTNGIYMRWDVGEIELGNYFMRLVCENGQMARIDNKAAKIHSLSPDNINRIFGLLSNQAIMNKNFLNYKKHIVKAIGTQASIAELKYAFKTLLKCNVNEDDINTIIPFQKEYEHYKNRGFNISKIGNRAKSSLSIWDVYNKLTEFASHTKRWLPDDYRRCLIIDHSNHLLLKQPDIVTYAEMI